MQGDPGHFHSLFSERLKSRHNRSDLFLQTMIKPGILPGKIPNQPGPWLGKSQNESELIGIRNGVAISASSHPPASNITPTAWPP